MPQGTAYTACPPGGRPASKDALCEPGADAWDEVGTDASDKVRMGWCLTA